MERTPIRARICKLLRRPGIDSEDSIPPAYVEWRAGTTNRVVVAVRQARNRLLCSLKGLQIRAQPSETIASEQLTGGSAADTHTRTISTMDERT
jgi:hypothetical protein